MSNLKVVIVDDHPLLLRGLADLLAGVPDVVIAGEARNGAQALELINSLSPDIAIVDVDMPVMDGIELVKMLRKHRADIEVIFLTIHKDRSILRALNRLDVKGYVLKESATDEIVDCIRSVAAGTRFVSPKLEGEAKRQPAHADGSVFAGLESLTSGEFRVLDLISRSRTNREIGEELYISVRTVETHRYNICSKLGLKGPHSLLKFAIANKAGIQNANSLRGST